MKICITGDSWACGEWEQVSHGFYGVVHKGLEEYLSEKHSVVNLGLGGSGNNSSIERLKECLQYNKFDYVFWFKTDPSRDFDLAKFIDQKEKLSIEDVFEKLNFASSCSYRLLNEIGIPIHCIGGCAKLNTDLMYQFSNLVPYIPCLTEMLEPEYTHPEIWIGNWITSLKRQFDYESLKKLLDYDRTKADLRKFKKYFWPDGRHPNRLGHKVLYEKICQDFNL